MTDWAIGLQTWVLAVRHSPDRQEALVGDKGGESASFPVNGLGCGGGVGFTCYVAAVYNILAHIDLYDFGRVEMQGVCLPEIRTSHLEIDLLRSYQVCACLRVCVCVWQPPLSVMLY